jgi:exopolysaccharide biosynthesis protein
VNLNDPRARVDVAMASGGIGTAESWSSLLHRANPVAAVNGTFFSKHTLRPTGDIVCHGCSVYYGGLGSGLCITADNKASVASAEWGRHIDWSSFAMVLSGGFKLLSGGRIVVNPRSEGFKDSHVFGRARRTAVGVTNINRLLMVTTVKGATPHELAAVMQRLQCLDAIGIDGGASAGMYYRGNTLCRPGRALTNILVVYEDGKPPAASATKPERSDAPGAP